MTILVRDFVGQCSQCEAVFKRPVEDDTPADYCQSCWRDDQGPVEVEQAVDHQADYYREEMTKRRPVTQSGALVVLAGIAWLAVQTGAFG